MPERFAAADPAWSDSDSTAALPRTPTLAELLVGHHADRLSEQIGLKDGESAVLVTRGPGAGSTYRLSEESVTLGRSTVATIVLDDVSVSRHHAEIRRDGDAYRVVDVGSLNGTYVAGILVDEAVLTHGQEIQIGRFKLTFLTGVPEAR